MKSKLFSRYVTPAWLGILVISSMLLMGQESCPPQTAIPQIADIWHPIAKIGESVTISGTNFGTSQDISTVTFNGIDAGQATSWSDTTITINVPEGDVSGDVIVTVSGQSSNAFPFNLWVAECLSDVDCDDVDETTSDFCNDGQCEHEADAPAEGADINLGDIIPHGEYEAGGMQGSNDYPRPSDKTMKSLAVRYLNERNRMLVSSKPDLIPALDVRKIKKSDMSPQIAAQQRIDIEKIRNTTMKVEDMAGQYWNRFDTEVNISDIEVEPEKTTAHIQEYTRLYFIPGKGSGCSSFVLDRVFSFTRNKAQWIISDAKVEGEFSVPPLNEPSVEPAVMSAQELGIRPATPEEIQNQIAEAKANDANAKANMATDIMPQGSGGWNGQMVIDYCRKYAVYPNTYWYKYYSNADCTNFISQVLDQAGWRYYDGLSWDDASWFSYRQGPGHFHLTNTFVNAHRFFNHCNVRRRVGWTYDYNSLRLGDVVQIDINRDGILDHSVIISIDNGYDYRLKYYSQHTPNYRNMNFTRLLSYYPNSRHWYVLMHTH